jgi:hypothetical protein
MNITPEKRSQAIVGQMSNKAGMVSADAIWLEQAISLIWHAGNGLATFDFDSLTKLVFLCHEARIRCCIDPGGPRMFRLSFWPRKKSVNLYERHPNLDEAVAAFRQYLPSDHRVIATPPEPEVANG